MKDIITTPANPDMIFYDGSNLEEGKIYLDTPNNFIIENLTSGDLIFKSANNIVSSGGLVLSGSLELDGGITGGPANFNRVSAGIGYNSNDILTMNGMSSTTSYNNFLNLRGWATEPLVNFGLQNTDDVHLSLVLNGSFFTNSAWFRGHDTNGNAIETGRFGWINNNNWAVSSGLKVGNWGENDSILHVYENSPNANAVAGATIEQAGAGDSLLHFLLEGGQRYTLGIDNSDGDKFKISENSDLSSATLTLDDGKLGIGTTSPVNELDVHGSVNITGGELTLKGDGDIAFDVHSTDGSWKYSRWYNNNTRVYYAGLDNSANRFVFGADADGSQIYYFTNTLLGIGTNSPSSFVHSTGDIRSDGIFRIRRDSTTANIYGSSSDLMIEVADSNDIHFKTNNTINATLKDNGNFGIGIQNPPYTATISGSSATLGIASPSSSQIYLRNSNSNSSSLDKALRFTNLSNGTNEWVLGTRGDTYGFDSSNKLILYHYDGTTFNDAFAFESGNNLQFALDGGNSTFGSSVNGVARMNVSGALTVGGQASLFGTDSQQGSIYMSTDNYGLGGNFAGYYRNLIKANGQYVEIGHNSTLLNGIRFIAGSAAGSLGSIDFRTDGSVSRMWVDKGGNVGVGTTSPIYNLHVTGSGAFGGALGVGTTGIDAMLNVVGQTSGENIARFEGTQGTLFSVTDSLEDSLFSVNNIAGIPVLEAFSDDRVVMGEFNANDFVLKNNNIGLGIENPTARLQVSGEISGNSNAYFDGNVGIGTQNQSHKLNVSGNARFWSGQLYLQSSNDWGRLFTKHVDANPSQHLYLNFYTNKAVIGNGNNQSAVDFVWQGDTNNNMLFADVSTENFGLGTANPSEKLDVRGNVKVLADNSYLTFGNAGNGSNVSGRWLSIEGNTDTAGEGSSRIFFAEHNSSDASKSNYGFSIGYRGGDSSIVGADGNTWGGLSQISNGHWGMWGHDNNADGSLIMYGNRAASWVNFDNNSIYTSGSIGINTTSPEKPLTVKNDLGTNQAFISFRSNSNSNRLVDFGESDAEEGFLRLYDGGTVDVNINADGNTYFNGGNVGIKTTSPSYTLDVNGITRITDWLGIGKTPSSSHRLQLNGIDLAVSTNQTNYRKGAYIEAINFYDIATGATDAGYRIAVDASAYVSDTDFEGTLASQFAVWARHGANVSSAGSTITNSYGVYIDSLETANTSITNLWGLYQNNSNAKNYFAGNVGIGTSSPAHQLDLYKSVASSTIEDQIRLYTYRSDFGVNPGGNAILFQNQDGNNNTNLGRIKAVTVNDDDFGDNDEAATNFIFSMTNGGTENDNVIFTADGRVGIGTTNPSTKLHVAGGNITIDENYRLQTSSYSHLILNSDTNGQGAANAVYLTSNTNNVIVADSNNNGTGNIILGKGSSDYGVTNWTEFARFTNAGKVGIGTTSPSAKLEVNDDTTVSLANQPKIISEFTGTGTDGRNFISVTHEQSINASALGAGVRFRTRVDTSGTAGYLNSYIFQNSAAQGHDMIYIAPKNMSFYVDGHDNDPSGTTYTDFGTHALEITESGSVGIGTTSPSEKLDVVGNIKHQGLTMTSGTDIDQLTTLNKTLTITTGWQDTGISSTDLATGTYIVQLFADDFAVGGGQYDVMYSATMSWHSGSTNDSDFASEIVLHRVGHADNNKYLYLRTQTRSSGVLHLQIAGNYSATGSSTYTFKFRRMI